MIPVFDIEALEWVFPIAVGLYARGEYVEFLKTSDEHDVIWEFLEYIGENMKGVKLYAHNAANYDSKFIVNRLLDHGQTVKFAGGTTKILWVEPKIYFEDSYAVLGTSLRSVCKAFEVDNKLTWDHMSTENLWEMPKNRLDAFRAYMKRDCISLSEALDKYCHLLLDHFNVTPSSTLSLTSVKAFDKNFFPVREIASNEKLEPFIRAATYGGRNEVYKKYGEEIHLYDIRSMYTSCYDVPVPVGELEWTPSKDLVGTLAEAKVKVPDNFQIGPLPYRESKLEGHLIFPIGEFQGWYDVRELKNAVRLGCDVQVVRQLKGEERPVLKAFGEYVTQLRLHSNEDMGRIWKLFGIRLSGKFGQHRERMDIVHIEEIEDLTGYVPLDEKEVFHSKVITQTGSKSPYIKAAINMRIRAEARNRHLSVLLGTDPYYCDTDSVFTNMKLPTGIYPGQLQKLDLAKRGYFIHCKFYGYVTRRGVFKQKASGYRDFKLSEYEFKKLLEGKELSCTFQSMPGWIDILSKGSLQMIDRHRTARSNLEFSNRIQGGLETYPIRVPLTS